MQILKLDFVGSGSVLVDVMWFDIVCCEVKVVFWHLQLASCSIVVHVLLKIQQCLSYSEQILGFHSCFNNLHFLLFYDITLGYKRFEGRVA